LTITAIEFDFTTRVDRAITIDDVAHSLAQGHSVWVDLDLDQQVEAATALATLKLNPRVAESISDPQTTGRYDVYEDCVHLSVSATSYAGHQLIVAIVDLVLADRMIVTMHHGRSDLIALMRDSYPRFFHAFALSIGFLLFEVWDLVLESLRRSLSRIEVDVEQTRQSIFTSDSDEVFQNVSRLSGAVLELRTSTLVMRDSLDQLTRHTSSFVPATAQPHLVNIVRSLERLAGDLTVERETLAESLTLYLGIVSHRTNALVQRLTLVSIVFLPLTFLCGVYGMNFDLPEYSWRYGNVFFWCLVVTCATTVVVWMRIKKMW
jgi:magnesium transporter